MTLSLKKCANPICWKLEQKPNEYKRCSICKSSYYCSIECQKITWKSHKLECKNQRILR